MGRAADGSVRRAQTLVRPAAPAATRHSCVPFLRERARERERLLARRDRPRCPLLVDGREGTPAPGLGAPPGCPLLVDEREDTPELGAGRRAELVPAHERLCRVGTAGGGPAARAGRRR